MSTVIFHNVAKVLQDGIHNLQPKEDEHGTAIIPPAIHIDDHTQQQVRAAGQARRRLSICNNM